MTDPVNHPSHYTSAPGIVLTCPLCGHEGVAEVECIDVTRYMSFCAGNAMKYLWRHLEKGNPIQDLEKAVWYIQEEIARLKGKPYADGRAPDPRPTDTGEVTEEGLPRSESGDVGSVSKTA